MGWHVKKNGNTKGITCTCEGLKKKKNTDSKGFGACKIFITTLTEYFFSTYGLGTTSVGEKHFFTQQKEKCQLIQCFGPMFIDFDDYPHYSGKESIIL